MCRLKHHCTDAKPTQDQFEPIHPYDAPMHRSQVYNEGNVALARAMFEPIQTRAPAFYINSIYNSAYRLQGITRITVTTDMQGLI
ncbi:hypothetical protein L195_g030705 [Trifolium pratense]|uniref:Uncharacterized protein n=1 Tax=Trifolium pratense TaxID=57577 RepID=A0A2K3L8B8_TRIPR|nr:hypothetical protein L195_g030705 [Trifolium pratense]